MRLYKMPANENKVETVAKLNKMGGKNTSSDLERFRPRESQMFSPEKKTQQHSTSEESFRRSSGRLQQRRVSQPGPANGRRNSLSLPEEGEMVHVPAPKPKKKIGLKKANRSPAGSPLKKLGYNLQLDDNPKVNLAESPAKNTRSRKNNLLESVAEANLPVPESLVCKSEQQSGGNHTAPSSNIHPAKTSPQKRKAEDEPKQEGRRVSKKAAKQSQTQYSNESEEASNIQDQIVEHNELNNNEEVDELPDPEEDEEAELAVEADEGAEVEAGGDTQPAEPAKKKRGRPPKDAKKQQDQQDKKVEDIAKLQAQKEEADNADRDELDRCKEKYTQNIQEAIKINGCEHLWSKIGGGAYMIKKRASPKGAVSDRGKAVIRHTRSLIAAYKSLMDSPSTSSKVESNISNLWDQLEGKCELLAKTSNNSTNREIVKDMYMFVIPALVILCRYFLSARLQEYAMDTSTLRALVRLLDITIDVCERARSWEPQPSTLDSGVKRWVKNQIYANLKQLQKAFASDLASVERFEQDRLDRQRLREEQILALEVMRRRIEKNKLLRTRLIKRSSPSALQEPDAHERAIANSADASSHVHDIDELDGTKEVEGIVRSTEPKHNGVNLPVPYTESPAQRSRLNREPTADLPPPPPINFSEEEKMALLNGLQIYTGEDRYNNILNDVDLGRVLGKRDLDDLVKVARSFSQMMASKLGTEAYRADISLAWLSSTEPDRPNSEP